MKNWLFAIVLIAQLLLGSCIGVITTQKSDADQFLIERNNSMELLDALELFTSVNSPQVGAGDIRIHWDSDWEMGQGRKGTFHITMDSLFSGFYMDKRQIPVPWEVQMVGGRNIYLSCTLRTARTGGNESISIVDYLKKKKLLIEDKCYPKLDLETMWLFPEFRHCLIKLPSGKRIYVIIQTFASNGVFDQAIYFNSDGSSDIPFPEELTEKEYDRVNLKNCP